MLFGYGWLNPVVSSGRIGSASGDSDSSGSAASIGQVMPRAPSASFRLLAEGAVNTSPLLAAPTDRLCPVPMTPPHVGGAPASPASGFDPPPPQPAAPVASAPMRAVQCPQRIARRS